jgi:uncharacterized membrane protein YkvA (DUF1232 family)
VTGRSWADALISLGIALLVIWLLLIAALAIGRPKGSRLRDALRLLPDLLRLLRRLATDRTLPRRARWLIAALGVYLALPFDLVPDFIPVLGYADDAIFVTLVLRFVVHTSGREVLRKHWQGTDGGLKALCRLTGLTHLA